MRIELSAEAGGKAALPEKPLNEGPLLTAGPEDVVEGRAVTKRNRANETRPGPRAGPVAWPMSWNGCAKERNGISAHIQTNHAL